MPFGTEPPLLKTRTMKYGDIIEFKLEKVGSVLDGLEGSGVVVKKVKNGVLVKDPRIALLFVQDSEIIK